jgi:hypothetical protein
MLTRVVQRKRPRRSAALASGVGLLVATALIASVAIAALVSDSGSFSVIVANKNSSSGLVDLGNASVEYIGSSAANESSGTGLFDPFVRLQGSPTEKGYNTNGPVAFDTKSGIWTHAILATAIPVVDCDGNGSGTRTIRRNTSRSTKSRSGSPPTGISLAMSTRRGSPLAPRRSTTSPVRSRSTM